MSGGDLEAFLDQPFLFRDRPSPLAGDMRASWRLPVVLMLVRACRGQRATHGQLHVLSWALRSAEGAVALDRFLGGKLRPQEAVVRFEPALDRAIALAHGLGLLSRSGGRYWALEEKGLGLLARVESDESILARERETLAALNVKLTQQVVAKMLRREAV
jgi:hypothetical protein